MTIFRAGFIGAARLGSGMVIARLDNGTWSAPSAIGLGGGSVGGLVGAELTDNVFILSNDEAVNTFKQAGQLNVGGNLTLALGLVGRSAEAAGVMSWKNASGMFAFSKSRGLFAGASLETAVLIERSDANEKMYSRRVSARSILSGEVPPPTAANELMRALNSRAFARNMTISSTMYNDAPVYDNAREDLLWQGKTGSAYGEGVRTNRTGTVSGGTGDSYRYRDDPQPQRATTWADDKYSVNSPMQQNQQSRQTLVASNNASFMQNQNIKPARPTAPKPVFTKKSAAGPGQAVAKFAFDAVQPGDLGLKKGDVVTILKRTENDTDWWTGRVGNREGIFPR